ncbi:MAG: hypothetical protein PF692_04615 [Kiritimatiellae bacterium]|nr:hypothetical protein [Kiritimatiellia bacterium]
MTPEGRKRTEYIKSLIKIRRATPALTEGTTQWLENNQPEDVVSFMRKFKEQKSFQRRGHGPRPYKIPANQGFSFGCSIRNCRAGVLHPAEKGVRLSQQNQGVIFVFLCFWVINLKNNLL